MIKEPQLIYDKIKSKLISHIPPLTCRVDKADVLEVAGTKPGMQGKQKVDGYYFATIMLKPKDARFYFFPIYTHKDQFNDISEDLKKFLKGKSCFYIKKLDNTLEKELDELINKGVALYQKDNLI